VGKPGGEVGIPRFSGKILFIGFGSIARGLTPLLFRHLSLRTEQVEIITADDAGRAVAAEYGIRFTQAVFGRENYRQLLGQTLQAGDVVLNLAVEVSTLDVSAWCQAHGVLYLDTGIEPWQGGYAAQDVVQTTNYWLREQMLARRRPGLPTAVIAHGANPGLVSHLLKQALLELADLRGISRPSENEAWGELAQALGVRVIHVAERDTQTDGLPLLPGEFACTWSVDGLLAEAEQPAEAGWGSHETQMPEGMLQADFGCRASTYWPHAGRLPKIKSWVPSVGEQYTWLITHNESISIADFLTVRDGERVLYRPTVCYAYHPCEKTRQSLVAWEASGLAEPPHKTLIAPEAVDSGHDELGVLLCFDGGAYWHGSILEIDEARRLAPHNNATTLQVAVGMLGGLLWAIRHPRAGVVEADQIDFREVLAIAAPYLGKLGGILTNWQPQSGGTLQFAEFIDIEQDHGKQIRKNRRSEETGNSRQDTEEIAASTAD